MNTHNFLTLASLLVIACIGSTVAQAYDYNYPAYRRSQAQRATYSTPTAATYSNGQRATRLSNGYPSNNGYTTNRQKQQQQQLDAYSRKTTSNGKYTTSKSDAENAKFAGANNQETDTNYNDDGDARTASHLYHKRLRRLLQQKQQILGSPCFPYGRDAAATGTQRSQRVASVTPPPKEQGRFLWDLNVYNVYQSPSVLGGGGCGGYGGGLGGYGGGLGGYGGGLGGLGGGLLADPIAPPAYPPIAPLTNFLSLFAPGIIQNSLAATQPLALPVRPQLQSDLSEANDLQNDPAVDPNYAATVAAAQRPVPVRRPNRVYYDTAGAAPITPGQLVGGVATTVNGIIQQLTGNVQPVYPSYRRTRSYG